MVGAAGSSGIGAAVGWGSAVGCSVLTTGAQAVTAITTTNNRAIKEPYFIVLSPFSVAK
jgi:hypothetical protein